MDCATLAEALHKLNDKGQEAINEVEALLQLHMGITEKLAIVMVIGPRDWPDPHGRPMISIGSVKPDTAAFMLSSASARLEMAVPPKPNGG